MHKGLLTCLLEFKVAIIPEDPLARRSDQIGRFVLFRPLFVKAAARLAVGTPFRLLKSSLCFLAQLFSQSVLIDRIKSCRNGYVKRLLLTSLDFLHERLKVKSLQ